MENILKKIFNKEYKISFAQYGEDLIIEGIFKTLNLPTPRYIDIGAHHAKNLSNTYLFYKNGSSGVCIEPSSMLYKNIARVRPRDICLNIGISDVTVDNAPYYTMTAQTMNTFSKEDAAKTIEAVDVYGKQKIENISYVNLVPINTLLEKYFSSNSDIISIDTEGMDEKIVKSINLDLYRPKVFCIETIEQTAQGNFEKNTEIINYLLSKNYFVYADTYVNTIFVDQKIWTLNNK